MADVTFESKIYNSFLSSSFAAACNDSQYRIGVAVSGGADSVSLLYGIVKLFGSERVVAVTVNHNIRPSAESEGDCIFVNDLCKSLNVECKSFEIPRGKILQMAEECKTGVEDAARKIRYQCFEKFIEESKVKCLCLAHNQNDQLETMVMRFLKGSGTEGMTGIPSERGNYLRPLLNVSREEIENYLKSNNLTWRTDSTNSDTSYFRNKIRNIIIPVLNENTEGWQSAVLSSIEKFSEDEKTLSMIAGEMPWTVKNENEVCINFRQLHDIDFARFRRCIYNGLKLCGYGERLPYKVIREIRNIKNNEKIMFSNLTFTVEEKLFFIKKNQISQTEKAFFAIIEEPCKEMQISEFPLVISCENDGNLTLQNIKLNSLLKLNVHLPVIIRSIQTGDIVADSQGKMRSVSKILKNQHVKSSDLNLIPVVEECGSDRKIVAIAGSAAGYSDWIVKGNS